MKAFILMLWKMFVSPKTARQPDSSAEFNKIFARFYPLTYLPGLQTCGTERHPASLAHCDLKMLRLDLTDLSERQKNMEMREGKNGTLRNVADFLSLLSHPNEWAARPDSFFASL